MEDIYNTVNSGDIRIIDRRSSIDITVEFLNTGNRIRATMSAIKRGRVRDPMARSVYGVGYIGDRYATKGYKDIYKRWGNMLGRCYLKTHASYQGYGAKGVHVDQEWHDFRNYRDWFLERTSELCSADMEFEVDKDLKGGMLYSPDTCVILPEYLNSAIIVLTGKTTNNPYPGVFFNKHNNKYSARISRRALGKISGRRSSAIGNYTSDAVAFLAYVKEKENIVHNLAEYAKSNRHITEDTYSELSEWTVRNAIGTDWETLTTIAMVDGHGDILNEYYRT